MIFRLAIAALCLLFACYVYAVVSSALQPIASMLSTVAR